MLHRCDGSDVTGSREKSAAGRRRGRTPHPSSHSSSHPLRRPGLSAQGRSILHLTERENFMKGVDFNYRGGVKTRSLHPKISQREFFEFLLNIKALGH